MSLHSTDLFEIERRVVVITGGTRGIGLMIALTFLSNGCTVYVNSRKKSACEEAEKKLNASKDPKWGKAYAIDADLGDEKGCLKFCDAVKQREKVVDILINNAGTNWAQDIETYPDSAWDKLLALNVKSAFTMTKNLIPLLKLSETGGRVINIGSIHGILTPIFETYAYSASKAALHHLTKHLASRLARDKITVNAVACGFFPSKMTQEVFEAGGDEIMKVIPLKRGGQASDIGGICIFLASKAGSWVTGSVIPLDGGSLVLSSL